MECSICKGTGLLDHRLCDYTCEACGGRGKLIEKIETIDDAINYAAINLNKGAKLNIQIENGGRSVELVMDSGEVNEHCYSINLDSLVDEIITGTNESNSLSVD